MKRLTSRISLKALSISAVVALNVLIFFSFAVQAGEPYGAYYSSANDRVFWFIHITDIHVGASGSQDTNNLTWIVNDARSIVDPAFIVASGDLTDCTNGAWWPPADCPFDAEWLTYRGILEAAGMAPGFYYDIPGNHDAYNDETFDYYCHYNIRNTNYPGPLLTPCERQLSWTRDFSFGKYHFIGVNTAGNDGRPFSLFSYPHGDYAGLDSGELAFIQSELEADPNVDLTLIFGHHAMDETPGVSGDTWIFYGATEFASLLETNGVSSYGYGHTHQFTEQFFTGGTDDDTGAPYSLSPGIFYMNIDSLGKSSNNHFNITAIDCNGISSVTQAINTWPVVLITAPVDVNLGVADNPYAYYVPNGSTNPIRALVFDPNTPSWVQYRVDGGGWNTINPTGNPHQWAAVWNASGLSEGYHTIEVQATSTSGTRTDSITTYVEAWGCTTDPECDDSDLCNGVETCDGGVCQQGTPVSDGTPCGDAGTECTNQDTCVAGSCQDNGYQPSGTACGDPTGTECTYPDTCDGAGTCLDNHASAGAPCGDQGVECQVNDTCDGLGACIDNGFVADGTACGSSSDTDCDNPDSCLAGACVANNEPFGTACGDQGVDCHVDDTCDGLGGCTDNGFDVVGTACGTQGVECQVNDTCDGLGACIDNGFVADGTACGSSSDTDCDNPDSCLAGACAANNEPSGTACDDEFYCNGAETCDASGNCQAGSDPCPGQDCDEVGDVCISTGCDNDGTCETGEDCNNCPNDCISGGGDAGCGNGVCEPDLGEDCLSCPSDCRGKQVGAAKRQFCCGDGGGTNPVGCADPRCTEESWACSDVPTDPYCCGDGVCEGAEDNTNCPIDCGEPPVCGDFTCDPGENQCNCATDCGDPPSIETNCTDSIDNDCDSLVDCADAADCVSDPACTCLAKGELCEADSDCCSGSCHPIKGTCK